ncbi:hypothetical protein FSOLCH5_014204 [Fusarium solani]|uniref:uncharacterized protein n=1 Tax=Fusarium solani TaxID=169388 RepID=UPI0023116D8E|nr:hypothetical protein MRS44_015387 [Fusarium solani]KAJ4217913.1 hypothetical protein NW759_008507 [Fusarium solani]
MHLEPPPSVKQFAIPNGLIQNAVSDQSLQPNDRQQQTHLESLPRSVVVRRASVSGGISRSLSVVRTAEVKWTSGPGPGRRRLHRSSSLPSIVREGSFRIEDVTRAPSPVTPSFYGFTNPYLDIRTPGSQEDSILPDSHEFPPLPLAPPPAHNTSGLARSLSRALSKRSARRGSIYEVYEKAKVRGEKIKRQKWTQIAFEYTVYTFLLCFIYFVLVGMPLWRGAVWWLFVAVQEKMIVAGGYTIMIGVAALYAFAPLLVLFEPDPPPVERSTGTDQSVRKTALLIPCYKAANIIGPTLEAAVKIFPPQNIFVIANGNSPQPLDNTEDVCKPHGVNHIWSPVGSKIVAQFVGCYAAKHFKNVLLIDDDCALPPNFPIVGDRLQDKVMCIGYAIKSVGPDSSRGTLCQQAQDLEYKISGLQRALAGKVGSATFPHGAISLWDRQFLVQTFHDHVGFSVSEDWFMGHSCRRLGGRIQMCTSVFVETETPSAIFFSSGGSRGGFGEMTVFKQRFHRWNFFFVNGVWYNMAYILGSWKLGFWEIGTKIFVFQEVYETLLYLMTPFVLPISMIVRPWFCGMLLGITILVYLVNAIIFNEVHLRRKRERVGYGVLLFYYMPYKMALTAVNVASCYWSLFKYARYFAQRHPKVIEDERAVEVVVRLQEKVPRNSEADLNRLYGEKSVVDQRSDNAEDPPTQPCPVVVSKRVSYVEDMV